MKRLFIFLWLTIFPVITLLAERGVHGRDYSVREDSPFISPVELIGGIILIFIGYWALRGILSLLAGIENMVKRKTKSSPKTYRSSYDIDKKKIIAQVEADMKRQQIINLEKKFEIYPTSRLAEEISDLCFDVGLHKSFSKWRDKAKELQKKEEELKKQKEEETIKKNITSWEKEYIQKPSHALAERINKEYQKLKDDKTAKEWKIKALEYKLAENPRIDTKEADELFEYYILKHDYDKLEQFVDMWQGYWDYRRTQHLLSFCCIIPVSPNWQEEDIWKNKIEAKGRFKLLCKLFTKDMFTYNDKVKIMSKIASCHALGYGTEKKLTEALHWADLREEYQLKNIR